MDSRKTPDSRKKIAMVLYGVYARDARVQNYVDALVNHGWAVSVICLKAEAQPRYHPAVTIHPTVSKYQGSNSIMYMWSYLRFFVLAFLRLTALTLSRKCDVVHVNNMPDFLVFAAIVPKLFGKKIILDLHDTLPELYAAKFGITKGNLIYWGLLQEELLSAAFADDVIATSEVHKKLISQHGIPQGKISVVMNVANETFFVPVNLPATMPGKDEFRLIYHGTITYRLGLDILLEGFRRASLVNDRLRLSVFGNGDYLETLIRLYEMSGLGSRVHFSKRFVPVHELAKYINEADAGILANRADHATPYMLPVKLLECVHMHKPCIVPRSPAIEYYFDDTMVLYFEPENIDQLSQRILELSQNRQLREDLVTNALKFDRLYNWTSQKQEYFSILER